jgi:hypothetical protein
MLRPSAPLPGKTPEEMEQRYQERLRKQQDYEKSLGIGPERMTKGLIQHKEAGLTGTEEVPIQTPLTRLSLLEQIAQSRWAIGGARNCGVAQKTYTLEFAGKFAKWRDGANNTYVEEINYNNESEARTTSVRSSPARPDSPEAGTVWLYSRNGFGEVNVQASGRNFFSLDRCD